ncbi:MAG: M56 family metallopeptidase [Bacteroidales bacterium]
MNTIMIYLVKVATAHALLFLLYNGLLRRGTHFRLNRFYLISGIIIPFIIPLIQIHQTSDSIISTAAIMLKQVTIGIEKADIATVSGLSFLQFTMAVYLTGMVFMVLRNTHHLLSLWRIHITSAPSGQTGCQVRVTRGRVPAFSFFDNLYLDQETLASADIGKIILHEKVHIRQWHSLDVMLAELLCTIVWFNPFSWKIRGALKEVHEYLADAGVREGDPDIPGYFTLLTSQAIGIQPAFSNQFNQSLILKRLKMMTKNRSGRFAPMKALLGIPLLLLLFVAFSGHNKADALIAVEQTALYDRVLNSTLNLPPGNDLTEETSPQFPGGNEAMMKFMQANIRYPEAARKAGKEGVVYVQFTVTSKGSVTEVKVKKSVEASLDAEAVRVVSIMPDWIPGQKDGKAVDMAMVLPVSFKLGDKK